MLLNQASTLRVRIELLRRLSDGTRSPAALEMAVSVDRYADKEFERDMAVAKAELAKATAPAVGCGG